MLSNKVFITYVEKQKSKYSLVGENVENISVLLINNWQPEVMIFYKNPRLTAVVASPVDFVEN